MVLANLCVSYIMATQNEEVLHCCHSTYLLFTRKKNHFTSLLLHTLLPLLLFLLQAEELIRKIEKEEEQISYDDPDKKVFHLCIVNLVIG